MESMELTLPRSGSYYSYVSRPGSIEWLILNMSDYTRATQTDTHLFDQCWWIEKGQLQGTCTLEATLTMRSSIYRNARFTAAQIHTMDCVALAHDCRYERHGVFCMLTSIARAHSRRLSTGHSDQWRVRVKEESTVQERAV